MSPAARSRAAAGLVRLRAAWSAAWTGPGRWERALWAAAALWLGGGALVSRPSSPGDGGEYHLMAESLLRHASPALQAGDVASLAARERRQHAGLNFAATLGGYFEARDGRWYSYHFWAYPLATVPAKLLLRPLGLDLRAAQVTNAAVLLLALHQVLFAAGLGRPAASGLFGLALFSPACWFVLWAHPEAYCFALTLLALVWSWSGRPHGAVLAAALACAQNPPLVWLLVPLALRASFVAGAFSLRAAAAAAAAALPALAHPLFFLWKFGTPSVIARESAAVELLSWARAAQLLFDLELGLWPYMPLTVPLFVLALVWSAGRAWRPGAGRTAAAVWSLAALLLLAAWSCSVTGNWNHGTAGPSRYGVWLAAFVIAAVALAQRAAAQTGSGRRRLAGTLVAMAVAGQAVIVFARGGLRQPLDSAAHSWAAQLVWRHAPGWYSPDPTVFVARSLGVLQADPETPAVYRDERGCRKAWVRPRDAAWLAERCGPLPAGLFAQAGHRRAWSYVEF